MYCIYVIVFINVAVCADSPHQVFYGAVRYSQCVRSIKRTAQGYLSFLIYPVHMLCTLCH